MLRGLVKAAKKDQPETRQPPQQGWKLPPGAKLGQPLLPEDEWHLASRDPSHPRFRLKLTNLKLKTLAVIREPPENPAR
jgi:hypothetical protein